jgi:GH35 family endo-1,4-beta-xylanase
VTFLSGAAPIRVADTAGIRVAIESRSYNYITTIVPAPAPTTLMVSYRAQGNWYDLRDNGAGVLRGNGPEYGVGTVNYASGTVAVTLGALPDVGSEIIYAWGGQANYFNRATAAIAGPTVALTLSKGGVTPSSVTITWNDGAIRTATDNGKGALSGSATGTINYATGVVVLSPTALPAGGQTYSVGYTWGPPAEEQFHAPLRNPDGSVNIEVAGDDLIPGSVELEWNLLIDNYDYLSTTPAEMQLVKKTDPIKIVRDDGLGSLKDTQGAIYGSVNYATGVVSFWPDTTVSIPVARYSVTVIGQTLAGSTNVPVPVYRNMFSHWQYIPAGASMPVDETALVKLRYRATGTANTEAESLTAGSLELDLTPGFAENIVPGSINFTLGGKTYFDRLVAWARAKKLRLRAHTLIWHRIQNAPWLKAELAAAPDPAARLRQLLAERVTKVVGRYRGKVEIWDVINEPLAIFGAGYDSEDTPVTPKNIFYTTLGEGYIASAFRLARKADPKAKLFLNELLWDARIGDPKSDALLALVARLKKARVPIDGVGIQAHAMLGTSSPWFPSTTASLKRYIDALGKLGVKVEITELDVRLPLLADQPDPLAAQAAVYRRVASACAQARACTGLTVWGQRDSDSWLDSYSLTSATAPNRPLLLDGDGKRKLAYRAVAAGLLERRR